MKYELWSVCDGQVPSLVGCYPSMASAALRFATLTASHNPDRWTFWIQRPDGMTQENPEGLGLHDLTVLCAAKHLAQSRRKRRVFLGSYPGSAIGIQATGADLSELLRVSILVAQGKAHLAKKLPSEATLAEVQWQLRFA